VAAPADPFGERHEVDGGIREHRATGAIQVARDHVQDVDEPRREGAELLRAGADAAVGGSRGCSGEVAR
jgi:hypothetical protein